ncbi:Oxidoreductase family, NAD-binding Rossmann fold [Seminavis robusta]|uniref:Oxidoreductase family, NAD-binding Rossmann fold n=1 Tax=Seminavis robusta TaxID=568900 RepID=A0A9N8DSW4_9STRA|nr:Oxidoreductase family, NAD-binding Rossmann fold [Seminavis robusta]|eukprot:Sro347_g123000.1 Oxidoreductase family, NAD-binding Rossmann fold (393) ;mRNA; r:50177-51584
MSNGEKVAQIAMVGAGWWSQGWHLPHLSRNPNSKIVAIVDTAEHPKSSLDPNLQPLAALQEKYECPIFSSVQELFEKEPDLAASLDGVIVCTPHATHSDIGGFLLQQSASRAKPLHVLMEKPMTTNVDQAKKLHRAASSSPSSLFMVNHSANFIPQTIQARKLVESGAIGDIQHITGFMASPLSWIFEDPANTGWNEPTPGVMIGNGFAWGQASHLLAWIYHVCGPTALIPQKVYCTMHHSQTTGADVAHAASINCNNNVTMSLSGTSLLPGNAHSDPPVAKQIDIKIYGTKGAIHYGGDDRESTSGRLELRRGPGHDDEGAVQVHCPDLGFQFEELDQDGTGPLSVQNFLKKCVGDECYVGADSLVGFRSIQTLDAMYRSQASGMPEEVVQ